MADAPSYDKLGDPDLGNASGYLADRPPPYSESGVSGVPPIANSVHPPQPAAAYPAYSPVQHQGVPMHPVAPPPAPVQVPAPQVTNVVVGVSHLPPGTCTVCRRGKIEDTASCCTWFWCCMLLPFGIIPGIIAFCCCCRRPKCTHCGFSI